MLAVGALALAACGQAPEDGGSAAKSDYHACMVSDQGGFDDKSFNQAGHEGLMQAKEELGVKATPVESSANTDYAPNIDGLVQQDCDIIIGVGFLLEDPIQSAAEANPDVNFAIVDSNFSDKDFKPVELKNGKPIVFNTAEASYLAGYLAAGMSKSGKVATFGGMPIPSVQIFMDGFADGVAKYNEDNGTKVEVLGWNKAAQTGSFSGDFENQANGQNLTKGFIDQGADIVMPVAGPVGLGSAAAAKEAGDVQVIWVDSDGYLTAPQYKDIILTSVMKNMAPAVFDTVKAGSEGNYSNDPYIGTLENEGVGLAPFHDHDGDVPPELKTKIDELKKQIISGELKVESPNAPQG